MCKALGRFLICMPENSGKASLKRSTATAYGTASSSEITGLHSCAVHCLVMRSDFRHRTFRSGITAPMQVGLERVKLHTHLD